MYPLEPQSVDALQAIVTFEHCPAEHVWFPVQVVCNLLSIALEQEAVAVPGLLHVYVLYVL